MPARHPPLSAFSKANDFSTLIRCHTESSEASHLEAVTEPGCAAIAATGPLLLRSGALTGSGLSEYSITPDSSITNRGR